MCIRDSRLVDDPCLVRGHDGKGGHFGAKRKEHTHAVGERGAVQTFVDIPRGEEGDGADDPEAGDCAFEQMLMGVRWRIEGRGEDCCRRADGGPMVEADCRGQWLGVEPQQAGRYLVVHTGMVANFRPRGARDE